MNGKKAKDGLGRRLAQKLADIDAAKADELKRRQEFRDRWAAMLEEAQDLRQQLLLGVVQGELIREE